MSDSFAVDRRDFLLLRSGRQSLSVELSCERLLMKYLDAPWDDTTADLFARLDRELEDARELRLVNTSWLAREDLKQRLEPVLDSFRARGGRIVVS